MGITAAIVGSSIVGGMMSQKAASKASRAQQAATNATIAEQQRQFDILQANQEPYRIVGTNALQQYANQLGLSVPDVSQTPILQNQLANIDSQIASLEQQLSPQNRMGVAGLEARLSGKIQPTSQLQNQLVQLQQQRAELQNQLYQPANEPMTGQTSVPREGEALPTFQAPEGAVLPEFNFNLEEDPGYRFAVDEAIRAATRTAAAQGKRLSGNLLVDITDRAGGIASQYANQAYQRQMGQYGAKYQRAQDTYGRGLGEYGLGFQRAQTQYGRTQDYFNRLAAMAGLGQTSAAQTGAAGMTMAGNVGNALMQGAANQSSAAQMQYGGLNQAIQGGLQNYMAYQQNQNMMNMLGANQRGGPYVAGDAYMPAYQQRA